MRNKNSIKLPEKERKIEDLREELERYKSLYENASDALVTLDRTGRFIDCSKKAEEISGYTREELIGKHFKEIVPLKYVPKVLKLIEKGLRGEIKDAKIEAEIKNKKGQLIPVEGTGRVIWKNRKIIGFQAIARDITEKKKIEEELRESEEKYRTLVENLNVGIYRNTPGTKGNFIEANSAIIKMFGYDKKREFFKIHVSDLYQNPEDRKKLNEKLLKDGFIRNEELQLKKKDETPIWSSVTAITVYDENGKVKHYDGIIEDITERKKAEETLRESEEKYRLLVELSQEGICIDDVNDNIVFSNEAFANMLGYKKENIIGKSLFDFVCEEDKGKLKKESEGRRKGKASKYELRLVTKRRDIKTFLISATPLYKNGKYTGSLSMNLDITERRKAEERVKLEREQLLSIFEGIDEPIYVVDPDTYEILYGNKALEKAFGGDIGDIIGKTCYEIFQHFDKPCDFCTNDEILGKNFGKPYVWEAQNRLTKRWLRNIDRGIRWPDGREVRFEIAIDITDKIRAEGEMKRALEQEKKFKLETAHYFFNPIAIAKGYLDLMADEVEKEQKKKLKIIHHAVERVESVVRNMVTKGEIHE